MKLFETLEDLKPFIFRITDNGGETADRYTVVTCDGDYFAMSEDPFYPLGVGMTGEGYDPNGGAAGVEGKVERDIRWIDLPADCQRCVSGGLNDGFSDWLSGFVPPATRADADTNGTAMRLAERPGEGVYGIPGEYRVKTENGDEDPEDDRGPYATIREAVLASLPDAHDLSGEEFHTQIDMWDVKDGPIEPWNRQADPPVLELENEQADYVLKSPDGTPVAWFATVNDAQAHLENIAKAHAESDPDVRFERHEYAIIDMHHED